ncbi:MAG: peptidoglycan-binding protein [Betaproteobacteria bacterium]
MPEWSGEPLRRGSRGESVAQLQQRLAELGYDPGPVDGRFGPLTEEAVYQLQADYRLRRDGIAGRQVAQLLGAGFASALRILHTVSPGEDPYSLAERYGVSPGLLRRLARQGGNRRLTPGARLVIPVRPVLVVVEETGTKRLEQFRRILSQNRRQVTALIVPWLTIAPDGVVGGKAESGLWELAGEFSLPLVAQVKVEAPDGLVPTGRRRRQAVAEIVRTATRYRLPGLHLVFDPLASGEQHPAAALASALHRALPASTLLCLEVSSEPASLPGVGAVAELAEADCLVVRLPAAPPQPSSATEPSEEDRALLRPFLRRYPAYRLWLGLSASGSRAGLSARLSLVIRRALSGVVLWDLAGAPEAVFRAMADLFSVQGSQAWVPGRRNIRGPGA